MPQEDAAGPARLRCLLCNAVIEVGEGDLDEAAISHILEAHLPLVKALAAGVLRPV